MATDSLRDFDPSLDIPIGLTNARTSVNSDTVEELADPNADIDFQTSTLVDEDSELDEEYVEDELGVPGTFEVISQTVRTGPDGSQVVDVIIDVEEVQGAVKYEVRVTKV